MTDRAFKKKIWEYYRRHRRFFLWRPKRIAAAHPDPYVVFVSEIMLQQTQASRVQLLLPPFLKKFPSFQHLARAKDVEVLMAWKGLGYNRRALWIKKSAEKIVKEFGSILPNDPEVLETFPGIGPNTARSIAAFAFNSPVVFIETNIRRVFIHFFFPKRRSVHDREIMPIILRTLDGKSRDWYYALMDYGAMLPRVIKINSNKQSRHYTRQTVFKGSRRELRGKILALVIERGTVSTEELSQILNVPKKSVEVVAGMLSGEGFFKLRSGRASVSL